MTKNGLPPTSISARGPPQGPRDVRRATALDDAMMPKYAVPEALACSREESCLPPKAKEADLYLPIKRFLESQHYEVKAEIHGCDVFAIRGSEDPVVVELKLALNLDVVLQAVDRLAVTPKVYVGVPKRCRTLQTRRRQIIKLLRMLGLGLLAVGQGRAKSRGRRAARSG